MNINILDAAVVAVLMIFALIGGSKGLVRSLFNFFSMIASLYLTHMAYPAVSKVVRDSGLFYEPLKKWVIDVMGVQSATGMETTTAQIDIINSLSLPDNFLKTMLSNNNPEAYIALKAIDIQEYIGGYIANAIINIVCMVVVFAVICIAMRLLANMLDLVAKLPVIDTFNKAGGFLIGLSLGGFAVWLCLLLATLFFTRPDYSEFYALLESSRVAIFFYDTNLLFNMIYKIFV